MQITIDEATGGALTALLRALKDAEKPQPCELQKFIELVKVDDSGDAVTTLGIVYEPDVVDAQKDWANAATIARACEKFGIEAMAGPHMNLMHKQDLTREQAAACSSYIADADFEMGGKKIRKGTWLLKCKIFAADIKDKIRKGLLKGYSLFGGGAGVRDPKTGNRELTDMNVKNVAIVDSPANMDNFLLAKNTKGEPDMTPEQEKKLQECIDAVAKLEKAVTAQAETTAKADQPVTVALAQEWLKAWMDKLARIQAALAAGTIDAKTIGDNMDGFYNLTSKVRDAALIMAKAAPAPVPAPAAKADADPHMNPDGTFVNGFDGCVAHMMGDGGGHDEETAKKICGSIAQNAKGILKQADIDAVLAELATEKQAAVEKAAKAKADADAALVKANAEADQTRKLIERNAQEWRDFKESRTRVTVVRH